MKMNNKSLLRNITLLLPVLIYSVGFIFSQTVFKNLPVDKLQEKVALSTDREIYCTGELLFFKAFNLSNEQLRSTNWSNVLYIEIITPDGKPVFQGKFDYDSTGTSGEIMIPEDILTGNYYLRAYTKWMRNFSPYSYCYKTVTIINPNNRELLRPVSELMMSQKNDSSLSSRCNNFLIQTDKSVYQQREKVMLTAELNDYNNQPGFFCISVIRSGTEKGFSCKIQDIEQTQFHPDYIPETRLVSLSGKVLNQKDSSPVPFIPVSLSIINKNKNILTTLTDKKGCFYFSIPEQEGEVEVFISLKNSNTNMEPVIFVDNDFCSREVKLPFIPFTTSDSDKGILNELIFNSQISRKFKIMETPEKPEDSVETIPFYGSSIRSIRFNDYIPLPTIEDYLNEFLPNVVIRKKDATKYFQMLSSFSEMKIFEPLILVDYVAVYNVDWILSISPKKVDRIEVIEKPYILGDIHYGGLINIISLEGDFAGVNLPSSGQFFNFMMYSPVHKENNDWLKNPRIPDARNSLFWNPDVQFINKQSENFFFFTGNTPGEYLAIIRSVDEHGNKLENWCKFTVE